MGIKLTAAEWTRVVLVAGVGTALEWYDFYTYAQLSSVLKKVFFPKSNPTAQTLLWWAVYAVGFVVRPIGALIFGHIGDTWGRSITLRIAIVCMAIPTMIIGCLPTYSVGPYTAGLVAPILLTILRLIQGLAMGGEFGPAIIYISELAPVEKRGRLVACLQMTVNIGMICATFMVMILENTLSTYNMQVWGWRIPFLLAFFTALLGFYLRMGLPEPKAFLHAARAEKQLMASQAAADGASAAETDKASTDGDASVKGSADGDLAAASSRDLAEESFEAAALQDEGALTRFHGNVHGIKLPVFRVLRNNTLGLVAHVLYMAWVSSAFYGTATWLPSQLKEAHLKPIITQGIVIVSMLTNAAGLFTCGTMFDKGVRAVWINTIVTTVGFAVGFGVFRGVWDAPNALVVNSLAAWFLIPLFQGIVGVAMASVVLPATRLYNPLERTTGFSFGYNCGYGVIGGLTPFAVTGIIDSMGADTKAYAPAYWMLAMGGASLLGCLMVRMYEPRLNKPYVGRIE